MVNLSLIYFGKLISNLFRLFNLGNGSTWPGHIALYINKKFVKEVLDNSKTKIIIVAGTNGKTTTSSLIGTTLRQAGKSIIQNNSGANLLNGIASTLILNSQSGGKLKSDYAIFEIDENTLPQILRQVNPDLLILLNLFRDQLDRYGEVNIVASNWRDAISKLSEKTTLILNADDPQIAYFGVDTKAKSLYFGCSDVLIHHYIKGQASDSEYCPKCSKKLDYSMKVFSHLGNWICKNCGLKRPQLNINNFPLYPLPGIYNIYNTLASVLILRKIGLQDGEIKKAFSDFKPAFGRQEIVEYKNKKIQLFLSKNPTSFNQSFQTISDLGAQTLLIVLNDRIPDGRDISWIWDVDFPGINNFKNIIVSGDRCYDMALRLKYELGIMNYESGIKTHEDLKQAINEGIKSLDGTETLYILPTYSAMLESRKILTGKKIL